MSLPIDRRRFTRLAAAGGLLAGPSWAGRTGAEEANEEIDPRLMELGINALARSPEKSYFADGHRGASMISAYLLCTENDLPPAVLARMTEMFDLNWAKTKLCAPFPEGEPDPKAIEKISLALLDGGQVLREVGHNVIFASLAIKVFRTMPQLATTQRVDGVCELIRRFKPWRDGEPDAEVNPPPFAEEGAASKFILQEASAAIDRFHGFGQGFAGHMLTFGQALVELAEMGYEELAQGCRTAFCKYVTVTRKGPEADARKIPDHRPAKLRPNELEYWKKRGDKSLGIGHVFKYPYGYYYLLNKANDPLLAERLDAKAYYLF
ncbi:hypothetical protein [Blastopirellula marina]|uniref:Uncharacterized protein n=1 Tax=Blastopirellula marina TaxID=124 RepID=A0A2S8FX13_9BACT|nr:hypothetical protein [Blastopirellula marina]PQO36717.1 hypothetical protein C5Y98_11720 [Blastopirellula marina]PTL44547.1 hypothetical protein C5Y97_11730 [Blastopirellula marina]